MLQGWSLQQSIGLVEILNLMVGEILAMFPSSKEYGDRMGFLNQSTLSWMKYLVSTKNWLDNDTCYFGMENEWWFILSQGYLGVVKDSSISSSFLKQWLDRAMASLMVSEVEGSLELDIMQIVMVPKEGVRWWIFSMTMNSDSSECF